jgi:hypothetical protein
VSKRRKGRVPYHARSAGGYRQPHGRCSYPGFDCGEVALDGWVYCEQHHGEVERVAVDLRRLARIKNKKSKERTSERTR